MEKRSERIGINKIIAPVVEVFKSVQGEGKTIGIPSVFVRFFGCNLRCTFDNEREYCDTPYSITGEYNMVTPHQVYTQIKKYKPITNIIFTGGEPMLQQQFIIEVMHRLNKKHKKYTAEIETNGTIEPIRCFVKNINLFTISPKLKNSKQLYKCYDKLRLNFNALNSLYIPHKAYFKFVVNSKIDMKEIKHLIKKYPKMDVYLMPQGITREEVIKNSKMVVQICLENNFNFSAREHIILYNNKRGV